jgi:hypothetical protein
MSPDLRAEASLSVAALHLLLATHGELDELPVEWHIDLDRTIRPFLPVDHPQCAEAARLLASALELTVHLSDFTGVEGIPMRSHRVEGRWGGAHWLFVAYAVIEPERPVVL